MTKKELISKLNDEFVYLDEKDMAACWRRAEGYARMKRLKGAMRWTVIGKVCRKFAERLNDERMKRDLGI